MPEMVITRRLATKRTFTASAINSFFGIQRKLNPEK